MEFDKARWPCPWNSDCNCTKNSAKGCRSRGGLDGVGFKGIQGMWGSKGYGVVGWGTKVYRESRGVGV